MSCCWIFVSWSETAESPFALTFVFFRSCTEVLRLARSVQRADFALALALALPLALLVPVPVPVVVVLLLQAVRNAAAMMPATASSLYRLAVMPAECKASGACRVTRAG